MAVRKKTRSRRESRPATQPAGRGVPLRSMTEQALDTYFTSLNGHKPGRLYDLVLREVEEPLFRTVLEYAEGNQSRAVLSYLVRGHGVLELRVGSCRAGWLDHREEI
mgnify:CR=1 FL=1